MMSVDRDALLCDLAETYGIFDMRALPASVLATLSVGLRADSRIKMTMSGSRITRSEMLLAAAVDRLSVMLWGMTEDGRNGLNRPRSVLDILLGEQKQESDVLSFASGEDFEAEWTRITEVSHVR